MTVLGVPGRVSLRPGTSPRRAVSLVVLATLLGAPGAFAVEAPDPATETVSGDTVVARFEDRELSADTVRQALVRRGPGARDDLRSVEEKVVVVEELLRHHVLAAAAERDGYLDDPEIRDAIRQLLAERYWRDLAAELEVPEVTDDEVRSRYEADLERLTEPERRRGSVLTLRRTDADAALDTRLDELLESARGATSVDFEQLVRRHSEDPETRGRGGDLGFLVSGAEVFRVPAELMDALFALERAGDVTTVRTDRFAHLVRLEAIEGGEALPLEVVGPRIRRTLTAERREEALASAYADLRRGAEIEIDRDVLRRIGPSDLADETRPPSFPVGDRP